MGEVHILIIEDEAASGHALRQVLDAEGWRVRIVPDIREGLAELASRNWSLVLVNLAMLDLASPAFLTLKELTQARELDAERPRISVLFLVPEERAGASKGVLEQEHLPYVTRPFHFHDLLERVSDLLLEVNAIGNPIRQVRHAQRVRRSRERRHNFDRRHAPMFTSRSDYYMTEEEIAEFERQERETRKKREQSNHNLGGTIVG